MFLVRVGLKIKIVGGKGHECDSIDLSVGMGT